MTAPKGTYYSRDGKTLQEVGEALGVTRERIRQIEQQAIAKCCKWCRRHGYRLEDLLDQ